MADIYKIIFRLSPMQEFEKNSLVTYRDENRLQKIKNLLYSDCNFFYIQSVDWEKYTCNISNGIDSIETSPDQLMEVVAYLEKIEDSSHIKLGNNRLENIIILNNQIENNEIYLLKDQKMGIFLENRIIKSDFFTIIEKKSSVNLMLKNYSVVIFKEDKIQDIL